jgi:hypothetical protein
MDLSEPADVIAESDNDDNNNNNHSNNSNSFSDNEDEVRFLSARKITGLARKE